MSSILKALKRLEQETAANRGTFPKEGIRNPSRRRPVKNLFIAGLILFSLCMIAGAVAFLFVGKSSIQGSGQDSGKQRLKIEKSVVAVNIPSEKIAGAEGSESDGPQNKKQVVPSMGNENTSAGVLGAGQDPLAGLNNKSMKSESIHADKISSEPVETSHADPFSPIPSTRDAEKKNPPAGDDKAKPIPVQADTGESTPPAEGLKNGSFSEVLTGKKAIPPVKIIKDPVVTLQAISWSNDVNKRMAIINGSICREKDRIKGYVIQSIHSDSVILTKGSVKGKLVFKIR